MSHHPMGFKISPLLQEHMCQMGSKLPLLAASEELEQLLRIKTKSKQIERVCHRYGEKIEEIDWNMFYGAGVQLKIRDNPVYCMADGSMLLTWQESWKEIKLGRIFSEKEHILDISKNRSMIAQSIYCAHFGHSNDFWERFCKEITSRRKFVFICDGAKCLPAAGRAME